MNLQVPVVGSGWLLLQGSPQTKKDKRPPRGIGDSGHKQARILSRGASEKVLDEVQVKRHQHGGCMGVGGLRGPTYINCALGAVRS